MATADVNCRLPHARLAEVQYTPCYCEENIYLLCKALSQQGQEANYYIAFISNKQKQIPLWRQKASQGRGGFICWDYHVILIQMGSSSSFVWDLDSDLPFPCPFQQYEREALNNGLACLMLPSSLQRHYRVVCGRQFLEHFSSDRSHMRTEEGLWQAEPPPYNCIAASDGSIKPLAAYLEMDGAKEGGLQDELKEIHEEQLGLVLTEDSFLELFSNRLPL